MSKFLERMERIRLGAPNALGFGASRGERTPAMALVGLISRDHAAGIGAVSQLGPDAALLSGLDRPQAVQEAAQPLGKNIPWGARTSSLSEEEAQAYQDNGCDLLAFSLQGTAASAVASDEVARILHVDPNIEERELRAVAALPVDVLLLPMPDHSGPWTLADLATIGAISRRVDKYILLEVSQPPGKKELEALRDTGVHGLVVDVASVGPDALAGLKAALLEMPRQRADRRRERATAILPGSVFSPGQPPQREEEDEEDD